MDKQKQIEEMANIIHRTEFVDISGYEEEKIAEELLKHYQPKIPENAVVLTKKKDIQQYEWSKLVDKMGVIEFGEKLCKETAEKFAERLKAMAYQSTDWSHGEHPMVVEVDYIDEICEEITDGEKEISNETV